MFSSEAISRDMSRNSSFILLNPSSFKHVSAEGQFLKTRDSMGSDLYLNQTQLHQHQHQHHQQQSNLQGSGLARYRSAPSSFLAALLDSTAENSSSGDESEALFSSLMDGPPPRDLNQKRSDGGNQMHYHMKQETGAHPEARPGSQMGYESAVSGGGGSIVGSYSLGMERQVDLRMNSGTGSGSSSNLVRQSSSPAGFFNGYGIMGEVGNYRGSSSTSSSRFMPSIPEHVNESIGTRANAREFDDVFPQESWTDATTSFNTLKRSRDDDDDDDDDDDAKMFSTFNGLEIQNGEARKNHHHGLFHHLSLPKTSSEMEKFLQFQPETVPCQIRAKRGCATHPRSIAERIRRTRISEKMKKLQDLFPNMDKQTSTADMLDLAVQFIKDLQKQVDTLTETKARCVCSNKPQQASANS